jgi:FkbM family methyltransferase
LHRSDDREEMSMSLVYRTLVAAVDRLRRMARLEHVKTHTFFAGSLTLQSVVVDLGANVGAFADELNRRFDCRCLAVEALPDLCATIPRRPGLEVFNVAISDADGPVTLHLSDNRECNSVDLSIATAFGYRGTVTCEGMTLETFLERQGVGQIDLLKVDIEGAEGPMFGATPDAVLQRARQVSIEFHDFIRDSISTEEVRSIFDRMGRLGFHCMPFSYLHPHMKNADVLFIQLDAAGVGALQKALFALIGLLLRAEDLKARLALRLRPKPLAVPG